MFRRHYSSHLFTQHEQFREQQQEQEKKQLPPPRGYPLMAYNGWGRSCYVQRISGIAITGYRAILRDSPTQRFRMTEDNILPPVIASSRLLKAKTKNQNRTR